VSAYPVEEEAVRVAMPVYLARVSGTPGTPE
jgi:hypothetical protein